MEGAIRGILEYIAPDCIQGLQPDRCADIFSLGILLYEMAAGKPPFTGESPAAVLYAIAHATTPALRRSRPDLPDLLEKIVLRALAKKREARTVGEVVTRILAYSIWHHAQIDCSAAGQTTKNDGLSYGVRSQ
jgi:serine/threonine protein kinase